MEIVPRSANWLESGTRVSLGVNSEVDAAQAHGFAGIRSSAPVKLHVVHRQSLLRSPLKARVRGFVAV